MATPFELLHAIGVGCSASTELGIGLNDSTSRLPAGISLGPVLNLECLATRYELSGGMIMNVIRHACLCAIADNRELLRLDDLTEGIRREYALGSQENPFRGRLGR